MPLTFFLKPMRHTQTECQALNCTRINVRHSTHFLATLGLHWGLKSQDPYLDLAYLHVVACTCRIA